MIPLFARFWDFPVPESNIVTIPEACNGQLVTAMHYFGFEFERAHGQSRLRILLNLKGELLVTEGDYRVHAHSAARWEETRHGGHRNEQQHDARKC